MPTATAMPEPKKGNNLFPIFLKLDQFEVLVVGGGNVGLEKLTALLGNSPATRVTVVGTLIRPELRAFVADFPQVVLYEKPFAPEDLDGKQFVVAATDDPALHVEIRALAHARGMLVNIADTPHLCDFYLSSIVQKGDLKVAISTNGKSPTVAKRLKETLHEALPEELNDLLQNMPRIRERLKGDFSEKVRALNELTASLAADDAADVDAKIWSERLTSSLGDKIAMGREITTDIEHIGARRWRRIATAALTAFGLLLIVDIVALYIPISNWNDWTTQIDERFWMFAAVGFAAQLVDGLLGMGYGLITQIFLIGAGVPLAAVSSSIHTAEMFSSGASGYSHYRFGNVNKRLFRAIVIPGVLGAIGGALLLSWFGERYAHFIKPALAAYTMLLGLRILGKAFTKVKKKRKVKNVGWLAGAGGFLDSFAGGGWGPLVTSTLLARGKTPQYVIGSVSLTEFFVTLASALTFFSVLGVSHWPIIAGLVLGGVAAAPLAARLAGRLPVRTMFVAVGLLIVFWSLRILSKLIF
jgi:uncharacterized protein